MILLSEQQYVPTVDGDLSQVQQKTLFSDGTSQAIAFLIIAAVLMVITILYIVISRQRNKSAKESIFLTNKSAARFNRILLLYNTLDNLPPTRKYLNRLRREFEMIAPGDAKFAKEKATWITLGTWGGGLLAGILVLFLKPTLYMLFITVFTVYIASQEIVNYIVSTNELKLMNQFLKFLSRFRYHYLIDNTVDDAIEDARAEVPHLMQLHAKLMLDVLHSEADKIDENLLRYKNAISDVYLKQFVAICVTTMQHGDMKVDGQSLCLDRIKDLRVDVEIEIRKRKDINAGFKGAILLTAAPVYAMQFISNWGVSTIAALQSFYYGTLGTLVMIACFIVTIAAHAKINQLRETHRQQPSEHYMLRAICNLRFVKKFTTNYWNKNYGKKLRVNKILRRTGNTIKAEHFLVRSMILAVATFLVATVVFIASNISTKNYVNTDYSAIAGESSSGTEEQLMIVMILTKYYFDYYKTQDVLALYNQANGIAVASLNEDVQTWFNTQLENQFQAGGATISENDAITLIQQYNQVNSANTTLYTKLFGTTGVPTLDQANVESVKAFNQMQEMIQRATEKDPLYNTTGLYDIVEKYTWDKYKTYTNTYFHWWFFLIALVLAAVAYNVPMILLKAKEEELQVSMQEEVVQYYSIILLLVYFEDVNALTILEWLNLFSSIFSTSISRCITEFTMDEQAALQHLYDSEPYEPFQRIVENLMMVDDVGVLQTFNELSATRKSNQETRSQDNKNVIASRVSQANIVMMLPLSSVAGGYMIIPVIVEAFTEMTNLVKQISAM